MCNPAKFWKIRSHTSAFNPPNESWGHDTLAWNSGAFLNGGSISMAFGSPNNFDSGVNSSSIFAGRGGGFWYNCPPGSLKRFYGVTK